MFFFLSNLVLKNYSYFGGVHILGHVGQLKRKRLSHNPRCFFSGLDLESRVEPENRFEESETVSNSSKSLRKRMDRLSNAFSVLEIDVDDHHAPSPSASSSASKASGYCLLG